MSWVRQEPRGSGVFKVTGLNKSHYFSLFLSSAILFTSYGAGVYVIMVRKDTFYRSAPYISKKFDKKHKEAFGEDTQVSKIGYPDMGSNIYSECLPYRDWVRINNAQRMHEFGYENNIILFPNAFICAMSFPRLANFFLGSYLLLRIMHINGYTDFRGHNKAFASEEITRSLLAFLTFAAMYSSIRLTGITGAIARRLG